MRTTVHSALLSTVVAVIAGCGGGSGPATDNPVGPSPTVAATITISSAGASPQQVRIQPGEVVRFVNNDSVAHVPSSNPHPVHTDCPAINALGTLQPGASGTTAAMTTARSCGFHDHNSPGDARLQGQILIGGAAPEPGPGY